MFAPGGTDGKRGDNPPPAGEDLSGGSDYNCAMAETAASIAFAVELLSGLGPVRGRRMFGGAGLYAGEVMFGLIDDEVIYLKADGALKADLAAAGSHAWVYSRRPD